MAGYSSLEPSMQLEVLALRAAGASFNAIAAELNKRGLKGPQGGRWYGATIARMVHGEAGGGAHRCTERCLEHQRECTRQRGPADTNS